MHLRPTLVKRPSSCVVKARPKAVLDVDATELIAMATRIRSDEGLPALSDFYVHYSLRVRLADQRRRPQVLSALNASVQDVFNEHGVQIMSPHYAFDPAAPVLVPKTHWFAPPASRPG